MSDKQIIEQQEQAVGQWNGKEHVRWLSPPVDIYEVDDELVVLADLPGVEEAGLDLHFSRGVLTLEAVAENADNERRNGFYRQFRLSDRIDADAGNAALKDGVLTLRLPKSPEAKPKRIAVRTLH